MTGSTRAHALIHLWTLGPDYPDDFINFLTNKKPLTNLASILLTMRGICFLYLTITWFSILSTLFLLCVVVEYKEHRGDDSPFTACYQEKKSWKIILATSFCLFCSRSWTCSLEYEQALLSYIDSRICHILMEHVFLPFKTIYSQILMTA